MEEKGRRVWCNSKNGKRVEAWLQSNSVLLSLKIEEEGHKPRNEIFTRGGSDLSWQPARFNLCVTSVLGEDNDTPLQYSCLENPMDGGAWWAIQSMGSLTVGHDWATSLSLFSFMHWRRKWQPTPVFLPGESQGRGAWWAAVYGVAQSRTQLKRLSSSSSKALADPHPFIINTWRGRLVLCIALKRVSIRFSFPWEGILFCPVAWLDVRHKALRKEGISWWSSG